MPMFENTRKERDNLLKRRSDFLKEAEAEQAKGNTAAAKAAMDNAKALNGQIDDMNDMIAEADRYVRDHAPKFGAAQKDLEEMGQAMRAGERVRIDVADVLNNLRANEGVSLGSMVTPTGAGSDIHDGFAGQVSGLLNQVNIQNMFGLSGWEEPYVVSDPEAKTGDPFELEGTQRETSDPVFAMAGMLAYEANVTAFVPKAAANLSPARYAEKVQDMALRALYRKTVYLMIHGDGASNPKMHGILNAKNTAGGNIYHTVSGVTAIDENTLNRMVYGYGGDEMTGGVARLLLTKQNLEAFGNLMGVNEKQPLYEISFDPGTGGNTGTIKRGGLIVPYTVCSAIGNKRLAYGDPFNYMLTLFGDYVVGTDASYMAGKRLITVLGDALLSGNLTVDKGMSVAELA